MRTRARTDATHAAIVKALRKVGCKVSDCSRVGQGFPDLIVRVGPQILLLEVKTQRGTLTEEQKRFHEDWPVIVVRSVDQALAAVGIETR